MMLLLQQGCKWKWDAHLEKSEKSATDSTDSTELIRVNLWNPRRF
jgi:hypothetical protein